LLTFEQIKELIELVAQRHLQGVEIERSGFRIKIDGQIQAQPMTLAYAPPAEAGTAPMAPLTTSGASASTAPAGAATEPADEGGHVVTSPIVGTFYRASAPDADPFVEIGSRVKKGQTLCIIEAMKLMNEIESDVDGVVAKIFPQNAQAVEYGEPLFSIQAD
jgi:acetyl-CoA carboxylase biotin carboxyl carrier protein